MKAHPFHEFPKHLYHAEKPAVIAHNAADEAEARESGYGDEYVHQEYPQYVDGKLVLKAEPATEE